METIHLNLLLADDDIDDCIFFKEALEDLPLTATLTTTNDGIELMNLLNTGNFPIPDILFLDLNMPRKAGIECLSEIKGSKKLMQLPVIIFSTSFDPAVVNLVYEKGALIYMRKPGEFSKLKEMIHKAITIATRPGRKQPERKDFFLNNS